MKKPAPPKAYALRSKLEALATRGINGERDAAKVKLERLLSRFDFTGPDPRGENLFAGSFQRSTQAIELMPVDPTRADIINSVKWAIEHAAGIPCLYRLGVLMAEASPSTATQLGAIARTVSNAFERFWTQYQAIPGSHHADRCNFILGLYEGMMLEERSGEQLPKRLTATKTPKARKKAIAYPAGISLHPYTIAAQLGKQIRFCVPTDTIAGEFDRTIAKKYLDDVKSD